MKIYWRNLLILIVVVVLLFTAKQLGYLPLWAYYLLLVGISILLGLRYPVVRWR